MERDHGIVEDASALLMPMMRFISPVDPMWLSTMKAIEEQLIENTLVRRCEVELTHVGGLPGTDGSFTACSFWYVECFARAGELENAQLLFEKLLGYTNHHCQVLSEELDRNIAAQAGVVTAIDLPIQPALRDWLGLSDDPVSTALTWLSSPNCKRVCFVGPLWVLLARMPPSNLSRFCRFFSALFAGKFFRRGFATFSAERNRGGVLLFSHSVKH